MSVLVWSAGAGDVILTYRRGAARLAGVDTVAPYVAGLRLVDHHCHGVLRRDLDRTGFETYLTEAGPPEGGPSGGAAGPAGRWGTSRFDSMIGMAVRRWCAPVLDLPAHASADDYLARRGELGVAAVTRRFLRAAGCAAVCVDTGFAPEPLLSPAEVAAAAGAAAHRVVRLETVAEDVVATGVTAAGFAGGVRARLAEAVRGAVGVKSVAAYRVGLELSGEPPRPAEVTAAAGRWLASLERTGRVRFADRAITEFLVWAGIETGLPLQFHTGYGDTDADLRRCDPLLLTDLLRATTRSGVPVMLLHCYPFHRQAAYLAQVFPHVFVDVGLATHNLGRRAPAVLAEMMELAPFGKILYSSDAYGLPELFHLGSVLFRVALSEVLGAGVADGSWTAPDARRVALLIGATNARRAYRLDPADPR